jgi:TetR/AcrR family fatty acid metabolism transcriptional regulator
MSDSQLAMDRTDREKIIIDAALKVFSTKGYASTRMADIAKEADMSYGLVYHYFENKEKLFDAIVEDWWSVFYDAL